MDINNLDSDNESIVSDDGDEIDYEKKYNKVQDELEFATQIGIGFDVFDDIEKYVIENQDLMNLTLDNILDQANEANEAALVVDPDQEMTEGDNGEDELAIEN